MKQSQPSLMDWLGFNVQPDFSRGRWFGGLLGALALLIFVAVLLTGLVILVRLLSASTGNPVIPGDGTSESIRNFGLLLTALFAAPFLVWRSIIAQKQAAIAEQGQITDRINKAVDGLGATRTVKRQRLRANGKLAYERDNDGRPDYSKPIFEEVTDPNLEVRTGSIYSLERIAEDSLRDHVQIMEILCAYIRENSQHQVPTDFSERRKSEKAIVPENNSELRVDLQAALSVVARRSLGRIQYEASLKPPYRLDLRDSNLGGASIIYGQFGPAKFDGVKAKNASLRLCNFRGAWFHNCDFENADLEMSDFTDTSIDNTIFDGAQLSECKFSRMEEATGGFVSGSFRKSHLDHTDWIGTVMGGDFQEATFMGANFRDALLQREYSFSGALFFDTDFSKMGRFKKDVLEQTIGISRGGGKTRIPNGFEFPEHWVDMEKIKMEFEARTGAKLGDIETYMPMYEEWKSKQENLGK